MSTGNDVTGTWGSLCERIDRGPSNEEREWKKKTENWKTGSKIVKLTEAPSEVCIQNERWGERVAFAEKQAQRR